jgi:hypothetical protein
MGYAEPRALPAGLEYSLMASPPGGGTARTRKITEIEGFPMATADRIMTDAMASDWYQLRYQKCLERHGPDSQITQGYKLVLDRISEGLIEELNLKVHYATAHSRPQDISD